MNRLTGDFKGASMFATVEQAMQYNRLAQYENTGLTPDEIDELRDENAAFKADIEARRLVRPCKCGSLPRERETAFGPSGSGYEVYCPRCKVRIENFAASMDGAKRNARSRWNSAALATDARMDGRGGKDA